MKKACLELGRSWNSTLNETVPLSQAEWMHGTRPVNHLTGRSRHWSLIHTTCLALRTNCSGNTGQQGS